MATQHSENPTQSLPVRTATAVGDGSDDEAVPDTNPSDTTGILIERLQAWKHCCGYFEDYISVTEKMQKAHAKEYEKVLKSISQPLKEGHHFDQSQGGIAGLMENMRVNTQAIANSHLETAKALDGSVLPILKRLHSEIKNKSKELTSGAGKSAKSVDNARNTTQKHIELLGQHSAAYDSAGGKLEPKDDPYVLNRQIQHRLHKQILEENNARNDIIAVQDNFAAFEGHIVKTIQQAMSQFSQYVSSQADRQKAMYGDMVAAAQRIPPEFEWMNFLHRNGNYMVDPSTPPRKMEHVSYPNQGHVSTEPRISGVLERKSRTGITGYKQGYYAVTAAKFLHQFEDNDNFKKDPSPELSLYLPDCTIGALAGEKFSVKGKDVSKGRVGAAFSMTHDFTFKAANASDAQKWYNHILEVMGTGAHVTSEVPAASPTSGKAPVLQTQGFRNDEKATEVGGTPASATPHSAAPHSAGAGASAPAGSAPHSAVEPPTAHVATGATPGTIPQTAVPHSAVAGGSTAGVAPQNAVNPTGQTAAGTTAAHSIAGTEQSTGVIDHAAKPAPA